MEPYKIPLRAAVAEFTEKKSRFISSIGPAGSEKEALEFLRSVRTAHREASHNVYCYRINEGGACRHSDDGEPSGTAGMPLLDVFLRQDVYDFCCVATRYFGGVLLGAGGLTRAYSRCGVVALESSGVGQMREFSMCVVIAPYPWYEQLKRLLVSNGAAIITEDFGAEVDIHFALPSEEVTALQSKLTELAAGKLTICTTGTRQSVSPP